MNVKLIAALRTNNNRILLKEEILLAGGWTVLFLFVILLLLPIASVQGHHSIIISSSTEIINKRPGSHRTMKKSLFFQFNNISNRDTMMKQKFTSTTTSTNALRGGGGLPGGSGGPIFNNHPMFVNQGIILGVNALGFMINIVTPKHYHVDLLGTGAFAVASIPSLLSARDVGNIRIQWSATAVVVWSVKLASFLFYRIIQNNGNDKRLTELLSTPSGSASFWFVSAAWGILCALPHTLGSTSSLPGNALARKVGASIFTIGFLTETIADYQKWMFKNTNPKDYCSVGLWSISQHPNWVGNFVLWSGIFIMNASALIEPAITTNKTTTMIQKIWRYRRVGMAMLGPAFMYLLFNSQATGKILEESYHANLSKYGYGTDPGFTKYIDGTPKFIPNIFKLW